MFSSSTTLSDVKIKHEYLTYSILQPDSSKLYFPHFHEKKLFSASWYTNKHPEKLLFYNTHIYKINSLINQTMTEISVKGNM